MAEKRQLAMRRRQRNQEYDERQHLCARGSPVQPLDAAAPLLQSDVAQLRRSACAPTRPPHTQQPA